jgi:hypothetical protein
VHRVGDPPELWSDVELDAEIARHLRKGPHDLKSIRRFGEIMDEMIERLQAGGERGTRTEIWNQILTRNGVTT